MTLAQGDPQALYLGTFFRVLSSEAHIEPDDLVIALGLAVLVDVTVPTVVNVPFEW